MADKSKLHCFICDNKAGVSIRNSVTIFGDESPASESTLPDLLQSLVNKPLTEDTVHSNILCKKCYKVVHEYDEMYTRMEEIKQDVLSEFKKTIAKHDLDYGSYGLVSNSSLAQNKPPEKETPKITNLANIPPEKVRPMPPNVVIIHKGRKLAIQRVNAQDIPNVGKINAAKIVERKDEVTLHEEEIKEESDPLGIGDGGTNEAAQPVEPSAEEPETALARICGEPQETEEAASPAQEAVDDSLDKEDDRDDDYDSLDADEEMIVIKEGGDHDSLINAIKSATKGFLHSSGNQIMIRGEDGKEVALLIANSEGDEQGLERSSKGEEMEDAEGQESTENTEQELQVSDEESTRQIIRVTTKNGATYIKLEPGSDLSRALSSIEQKADTIDNPIVERNGDLYTCILCANDENGDSEDKDSSDKVETGFVGVGGAISGHMKRVHGLRVHVCDVCGELLKRRSEYNTHLEKHLSEEVNLSGKMYRCSLCERTFPSVSLFRLHRRAAHGSVNKIVGDRDAAKHHPCNLCGKKYSSKNLLEEHMNIHNGVRPYECKVCSKSFASKYTYHAHQKTHTDRPRSFPCSVCPKAFYTVQNLNQHEKTHSGIKEFVCLICGKAFGTAHNLVVHGVVHSGHKPHECRTCGKAFARRAEIRDHERTHTGERPYACDMCPSSFSQRSNLQSHKRATHLDDKRYACQSCDKRFKRRRLLEYHVKASHTGERPYRCEHCSATFVYPEHFKKHRRIHSGEKPYVCEVCGKSFNSRDNRNAHRFIHSDKKPYECMACGAGFMRKPLLYAHMNAQGHMTDAIVVNQPTMPSENFTRVNIADLTDGEDDGEQQEIITINANQDEEMAEDSKMSSNTKMLIAGEHIIIQDREGGRIYSTAEVVTEDVLNSRQLIFTTPQGEEIDKATLSLVHEGMEHSSEMLSLVTKRETDEEMASELVVQESEDSFTNTEFEADQIEILTDESGHVITTTGENGLMRLVQVRLPSGGKGWVALDS